MNPVFCTRFKLSWPECREEISSYICPIYPAKIQLDEPTHMGHLHNSLGLNSVTWNTCGSFYTQPSICVWCAVSPLVFFFPPSCYMRHVSFLLVQGASRAVVSATITTIDPSRPAVDRRWSARDYNHCIEEERKSVTKWQSERGRLWAAQPANSRCLSEGGIMFTLGGMFKLDSCFMPPPTLPLVDYLDY